MERPVWSTSSPDLHTIDGPLHPRRTHAVLTRRIRWFDMGAQNNAGQHHHAWIVFDQASAWTTARAAVRLTERVH
jgi:hypothetical protein